jgi:peptide/nickel transport system substrate-binding protein
VDCLRFNIFKPPFDKIEMRQAIARAIDRERIVKEVYFGYSQPLYLPWGPNSPATDPAYAQSQSYDLDAAKALWEKAGSPKSGEAMILGSSATQVQMMQIIQQSLQQIGFQVNIEPVDAATNTKRYYDLDFGMTFNGLGNTSKNDPTRITTNSIFRTDQNVILKDKVPQEYIDGIAAARKALTPEAQKAAYDTLNKVITTQAVAIAIDVCPYLFAHKKSLTGVGRTADNWLVLEGAKMTS